MAISVHHGPNGSYKSSGVVADFFLKAAREGRTVVTNIRGMSTDRTFEHYPDTAEGFEVIQVDTSTGAGKDRISKWFHWAPDGALLLFDEPSVIFPKRWRDSDLKKLDNLEVLERMATDPTFNETHPEYRPPTFNIAFEMHRHWNWDIVIMTPNIKLLRSDIRDTSEGGYKHRNNALIGLKGSYNEGFHSAEDNGSNPSQFLSVETKRIKPVVFKLYDSTKTGEHQDTSSGTSIWKNGRFVLSLAVAVSSLGYAAYTFSTGEVFPDHPSATVQLGNAVPQVAISSGTIQNSSLSDSRMVNVSDNTPYNLEPFYNYAFTITASLSSEVSDLYFFTASKTGSSFGITSVELQEAGYSVIRITDCAATIVYKQKRMNVTCGQRENKKTLGVGA